MTTAGRTGAAPRADAPRRIRKTVGARNDAGVRTVVTTRAGLTCATDEPVAHGGGASAPTPLETVLGALCGCSAVTFRRAADEAGFAYAGIEFDAAYDLDRRGLLGEAEVRPYFDTVEVEVRVRTPLAQDRLDEVVAVTEHRCPVRNLFVDAGVALRMQWRAVAP